MKYRFVTIVLVILFACGLSKKDKSFKVFNEGVKLSLQASDEQGKNHFDQAVELNKQAIAKFRETLQIDSSHPGARSALGHSLYVDKQFKDAIIWFDQANKINGEAAVNYREMGLCKVATGEILGGKANIDKAFEMDTSKAMHDITVQDLVDLGDMSFAYGNAYIQKGEAEKGRGYKSFAIAVLILAFEYDLTQKDIARKIAGYCQAIGETETAKQYSSLAE